MASLTCFPQTSLGLLSHDAVFSPPCSPSRSEEERMTNMFSWKSMYDNSPNFYCTGRPPTTTEFPSKPVEEEAKRQALGTIRAQEKISAFPFSPHNEIFVPIFLQQNIMHFPAIVEWRRKLVLKMKFTNAVSLTNSRRPRWKFTV